MDNDDTKTPDNVVHFPTKQANEIDFEEDFDLEEDDIYSADLQPGENPVESFLNLTPGSTPAIKEYQTREVVPVVQHADYDSKDNEIEQQFQELYNTALQTFDQLSEDIENMEGKYRARSHEVATQYLNLALAAAKEKKELKQGKDKIVNKATTGGGTTNNTLVVTHAEMMKMIRDAKKPPTDTSDDAIDGEIVE